MGVVLLGGTSCLEGSHYRGDVKMEGFCVCSQGYVLGSMGLPASEYEDEGWFLVGPWSGGGWGALAGQWSRSRGVEVTHRGPRSLLRDLYWQ